MLGIIHTRRRRNGLGNEQANLRWRIAVLLSAAIAISYLDRQTLPVAVLAISRDIPLTNAQFSSLQSAFLFAYALMYAGGGKLVDSVGTRQGFTVIMLFWSLACASHGLATGFAMLSSNSVQEAMDLALIGGEPADQLPVGVVAQSILADGENG